MSLFLIVGELGIAAAALGAPQPIRLEVEPQSGANVVRVVAESEIACKASYELEVSGGSGGNRSVNRGTAAIPADRQLVLATVRVGAADDDGFTAKLNVTPCNGTPYQQVWPAPGS